MIKEANEFVQWSLPTFKAATPLSSLGKLSTEILEVRSEILRHYKTDLNNLTEEYVDCLMCIFDSAARLGITPDQLHEAFKKKLIKNKARKWKRNRDNTYSHIK